MCVCVCEFRPHHSTTRLLLVISFTHSCSSKLVALNTIHMPRPFLGDRLIYLPHKGSGSKPRDFSLGTKSAKPDFLSRLFAPNPARATPSFPHLGIFTPPALAHVICNLTFKIHSEASLPITSSQPLHRLPRLLPLCYSNPCSPGRDL